MHFSGPRQWRNRLQLLLSKLIRLDVRSRSAGYIFSRMMKKGSVLLAFSAIMVDTPFATANLRTSGAL